MCGRNCFQTLSLKIKLIISLDQQSETFYNLFLLYVQAEKYQNILKLRCWPLAYTSYKAFSHPASVFAWFFKKNISHIISNNSAIFILWSPLPLDIGRLVFCNYLFSSILKLTLPFWSSHFPTWPKKSEQKFKYLTSAKRFFGKIKIIFHPFKRLSLEQIKPTCLEGESPTLSEVINFYSLWVKLN